MPEKEANDTRLPNIYFNSALLKPEVRFPVLRDAMAYLMEVSLPPGQESADFAMESTRWALGPCVVSEIGITAHRQARSPRQAAADGIDHYVLALLLAGSITGDCDGRPLSVGAGVPYLLDFTRPFQLATDGCRCILVHLSPKALQQILPVPTDLHGVTLDSSSGRLLAEHLAAMVRHLPRLAASEAAHVGQSLCEMIAACVAVAPDGAMGVRPRVERSLLSLAHRYIDDNLRDTHLCHDRLCQALGISRSNLYRVFKGSGGVAGYIQRRRLAAIHRRLSDPREHRRVSAIAAQYGFLNLAHFSRVFRAEYGCSASEARCQARGRPLAKPSGVTAAYREWVERYDG